MARATPPELAYDPALRAPPHPAGGLRAAPAVWMAATVGVAVAGAMGWANPRTYSVTALLLGMPNDPAALRDELAVIASDEFARGVAERMADGSSALAPQANSAPCAGRPADWAASCVAQVVRSRLLAEAVALSSQMDAAPALRLTARDADPLVAATLVDAAVAVDRDIWRRAQPANQAALLAPQLAAALAAAAQTDAEAARIRGQAQLAGDMPDLAAAAADAHDIARRAGAVQARQAMVEAELAAAREAQRAAPAMILDSREVRTGQTGQEARAMLLQLKLDRAHMAQLYTGDYQGLAELTRKIDAVETLLRAQARDPVAMTRSIRNPALDTLAAVISAGMAEAAGLVRQRADLQLAAAAAAVREDDLRSAAARLEGLQQRRVVQQSIVQHLARRIAVLQANETLSEAQFARRRLLQRPLVAPTPWTGAPACLAAGALAALLSGIGAFAVMWRRRAAPGRSSWVVHGPALPPRAPPAQEPPAPRVPLADELAAALPMRLFPLRRDGGRLGLCHAP